MGLLGGLQGLGQGMAKVGEQGMQATLQQQRDDALSGREDARIKAANDRQDAHDAAAAKAAAAHDAAEEERQKSIYKWKNQADLDKISDPRYVADKDAEAKRKLDSDTSLKNLEHKNKLEEIAAENDAKAKAEKAKAPTIGGWKVDDAEKEARTLVAKGMGIDSQNFTNFDAQTEKRFANNVNAVMTEFYGNPDSGISGAYNRVVGADATAKSASDAAKANQSKARAQAAKEADARDPLGPDFLRPDATKEAFGPGGRDAWIDNRTNEILSGGGGAGLLNTPQAPSAAAPSPATPAVTLTTPATPSGPTQIKDVAGYNALPQGAHYIDPNGVERVKQ